MEQITEATHLASTIRGGASLIHRIQSHNAHDRVSMQEMDTAVQITRNGKPMLLESPVDFAEKLGAAALRSLGIDTLQVNVGKLCNQACKHCHVDASPIRTEIMQRDVIDACLAVLDKYKITTLDITGGAPEMIPDFRYFVTEARKIGTKVIVRHNLTVMFEVGQEDLPEVFAENEVELVSSLPYFLQQQTDAQRGAGVFDKSIEALKNLNDVGYGKSEIWYLISSIIRSVPFCRHGNPRSKLISKTNSRLAMASFSTIFLRSQTCR